MAAVSKAKLIAERAPSFEQLIRNRETQIFTNPHTDKVFEYSSFFAAVTKYGFGGLTHFSESLMSHVLNTLFGIPSTRVVEENAKSGLLVVD